MVDVVHEKVSRCGHYLTMHLKGFSGMISGSIKCVGCIFGIPIKFYQPVIIDAINNSKLTLSKRYPASGLFTGFKGTARVEIGAFIVKGDDPPSALKVCFLAAGKDRTALTDYIGRKKAVIATDFRTFYFQFRTTNEHQ